MRKSILFAFLVVTISVHAQVKIGINPNVTHSNAVLELDDTARGFLPPRMTLNQLGLIPSPATGMIVYVTDVNPGLYYNAGAGITSWKQLIPPDAQYWTKNPFFNSLYYNTNAVGIGVTSPLSRLHVAHTDSNVLMLQNTAALALNKTNFLDFKTGSYFTARIGTRGTGTTNNAAALGFFTNAATSATNLVERLTIADNGLVGIANTVPAYQLDVAGTFHTTGTATIGGALTAPGISTAGNVTVGGTMNASSVTGTVASITNNLTTGSLGTTGNASIGAGLNVAGNAAVNGVIQMQGGAPAAGKVLTASGNTGVAQWQNLPSYNTAFEASFGALKIKTDTSYILPFVTNARSTNFDDGNNFVNHSYIIPTTGVYHFDIDVYLNISYTLKTTEVIIFLEKAPYYVIGQFGKITPQGTNATGSYNISCTAKFNQGDDLRVVFAQYTGVDGVITETNSRWSGYRVY